MGGRRGDALGGHGGGGRVVTVVVFTVLLDRIWVYFNR